jgi:hypothetical protein
MNLLQLSPQKSRGGFYSGLTQVPGVHIIYAGALNCVRHRFEELAEIQAKGLLSFLCLTEIDYITGAYIKKTGQAITEIVRKNQPNGIILATGCQSAVLSTDYGPLFQEMEVRLGINIRVHEGCHLRGCDVDENDPFSGDMEHLAYGFLRPAPRNADKSVNIISAIPVDRKCEIFDILAGAGVQVVYELQNCDTYEEYQNMAGAHLNIICGNGGDSLGCKLEATLGIPYVSLSDVYGADEIEDRYRRIGLLLDRSMDTGEYARRLTAKARKCRSCLSNTYIDVEGGLCLAKWLVDEGFNISGVRYTKNSEHDESLAAWFTENMPEVRLERSEGHRSEHGHGGGSRDRRGGRDRGGYGNGNGRGYRNGVYRVDRHGDHDSGERGNRHGGRRGNIAIKTGYYASDDILNILNGGARQ